MPLSVQECCVYVRMCSVWTDCTVVYCRCAPDCGGCLLQGGLTAFFYAVQNSQIEAMRVLVNEFDCSPNTKGAVSKISSYSVQGIT